MEQVTHHLTVAGKMAAETVLPFAVVYNHCFTVMSP
jgi:hypothetical protein